MGNDKNDVELETDVTTVEIFTKGSLINFSLFECL